MNKPEISHTIEEALQKAARCRPDGLGSAYYTVRILATVSTPGDVVSQFVAAGWHLVGGPLQVAATADVPEHMIVTMLRHEPRPMEIRGNLRLEGRLDGEIQPR